MTFLGELVEILQKGGRGSGHWGHTSRRRIGSEGGGSDPGPEGKPAYGVSGVPTGEERKAWDEVTKPMIEEIINRFLDYGSLEIEEKGQVKMRICQELGRRTGTSPLEASAILASWAGGSNDGRSAVMIQAAAAEEFDVELSEWQKEKLRGLGEGGNAPKWTLAPPHTREILRAIYDSTQEAFTRAGYDSDDLVTLYRGAFCGTREATRLRKSVGAAVRLVRSNALESWSDSLSVAEQFLEGSDSGFVLEMAVPVRSIFSLSSTGIGCPDEREAVLLHPRGRARLRKVWLGPQGFVEEMKEEAM